MKAESTVVLGVAGSIASYKACDIAGLLRKRGYTVIPVMTKEAQEFITPLTLETIACHKVYIDMFRLPDEWDPAHISLADRAGLILIAPATANIIGKLASGVCDDLLTCVVYAAKAPILIAPAMNENMYTHPVVQENIKRLKKLGYRFIGPIKGHLACGREGLGHLAGVEEIVAEAGRILR